MGPIKCHRLEVFVHSFNECWVHVFVITDWKVLAHGPGIFAVDVEVLDGGRRCSLRVTFEDDAWTASDSVFEQVVPLEDTGHASL